MGVPERITRRFTSREFRAWNVSESGARKQDNGERDASLQTRVLQTVSFVTKEKANLAIRQMHCQSPQRLVRDDHH